MFIVRPFPLRLSRSLGAKMPCHFMGQPSEIKENQINRHAQTEVNYFGFFSSHFLGLFILNLSLSRDNLRVNCVCDFDLR